MRERTLCEKNLTCNSKRIDLNKFIFEPFEGPFDAGISDGLIATAILGSARGSRAGDRVFAITNF